MIKALRTFSIQFLRVLGVVIITVVIAFISTHLWLLAIGRWLAIQATPEIGNLDAIIVHGGNATRTNYGIDLYRRGLAPEFWHTGYARGQVRVTAAVER